MANLIKLLIVEDDMIIAAKISLQLARLGYEVTAIVPRGEDAIRHAQEHKPDLVLLDINLKGTLDGIETAHQLNRLVGVPIIYVTANTDEATFNRAKETRPYAFITKPIKNIDLQRAIELTISRMTDDHHPGIEQEQGPSEATPFVLSDRIFVRHKEKDGQDFHQRDSVHRSRPKLLPPCYRRPQLSVDDSIKSHGIQTGLTTFSAGTQVLRS